MLTENGPTWTRRKIQVTEAFTKLLFPNALTHTVAADYMLVYSRQFGLADKGQTMWIRISNPDTGMRQHWFPEEGGKEWFVDAGSRKNKQGASHPAGEFCDHVFFMSLELPIISHSRCIFLLKENRPAREGLNLIRMLHSCPNARVCGSNALTISALHKHMQKCWK